MEIEIKQSDKALIINIIGRLDTTNHQDADAAIFNEIEKGAKILIINCSRLDYISSSGLRIFLKTLKHLKTIGGDVIVCCLKENISSVFEMSGFTNFFKIFDTEEEAKKAVI